MSEIEKIVESGLNSKDRINEAIEALRNRIKICRHRMINNLMSVDGAANEIYACNNWIDCFTELKNSL